MFPVFSCPKRNVTTKINGINSFTSENVLSLVLTLICQDESAGMPGDREPPLNPNITRCDLSKSRFALLECKNNCKGGKYKLELSLTIFYVQSDRLE